MRVDVVATARAGGFSHLLRKRERDFDHISEWDLGQIGTGYAGELHSSRSAAKVVV